MSSENSTTGLKELTFFIGKWILRSKHLNSEGRCVVDPIGNAIFSLILDTKGIQEDAIFYFQGKPFNTKTLIAFDSQRNLFRFAILDNKYGFLDIHQGSFINEELIVSNISTGTSFIRDNHEFHYKTVYKNIKDSSITMSIFLSLNNGEEWKKINETIYIKEPLF